MFQSQSSALFVVSEFEKQVYLAFKDILKGPRAEFRKAKAVLPLIHEYKESERVRVLLVTQGAETICQTLCNLLTERVFVSEENAKLWFLRKGISLPSPPATIFQASQLQLQLRPSQLPTFDFALSRELVSWMRALSEKSINAKSGNKQEADVANTLDTDTDLSVVDDASDQESSGGGGKPRKLEVYVPFSVQHHILCRVQTLLENAAFHYGQKHMPSVLQNNNWLCPEAGELNLWVQEFRKYLGISDSKPPKSGAAREINEILKSATRIRHNAVHREYPSMEQLRRLLDHAEKLCTILESDSVSSPTLKRLQGVRSGLEAEVAKLKSRKGKLETELKKKMDDIAARRAELDALEKRSIEEAHVSLHNDHLSACITLEDMLLERDLVLFCAGKITGEDYKGESENHPDAELGAELGAAPVAEPVTKPVSKPVAEPSAEPVAEPVAEPIVEPSTEPVAKPVAEPDAEPDAEPIEEERHTKLDNASLENRALDCS